MCRRPTKSDATDQRTAAVLRRRASRRTPDAAKVASKRVRRSTGGPRLRCAEDAGANDTRGRATARRGRRTRLSSGSGESRGGSKGEERGDDKFAVHCSLQKGARVFQGLQRRRSQTRFTGKT